MQQSGGDVGLERYHVVERRRDRWRGFQILQTQPIQQHFEPRRQLGVFLPKRQTQAIADFFRDRAAMNAVDLNGRCAPGHSLTDKIGLKYNVAQYARLRLPECET
jgi:hypothetical protein